MTDAPSFGNPASLAELAIQTTVVNKVEADQK